MTPESKNELKPPMQPWSERLRAALKAYEAASRKRAQLETEIANEFRSTSDGASAEFQQALADLDRTYQEQLAESNGNQKEAKAALEASQTEATDRIQAEFSVQKQIAIQQYNEAKETLDAEFKESRWTFNTLAESERKLARDHYRKCQFESKNALTRLRAVRQEAYERIQKWSFVDTVPVRRKKEPFAEPLDPWSTIQQCQSVAEVTLVQLDNQKIADWLNGSRPWMIVSILTVLTSLGCFGVLWFLDTPMPMLLVSLLPVILIPLCSLGILNLLQGRTEDHILELWDNIFQATQKAKKLQPIYIRRLRQDYQKKKTEAKANSQRQIDAHLKEIRGKLAALRAERDERIKQDEEASRAALTQNRKHFHDEFERITSEFSSHGRELTRWHQSETESVKKQQAQRTDEINRQHAKAWGELLQDWRSACSEFQAATVKTIKECDRWFGPWNRPYEPQTELPMGLEFGYLDFALDRIPNGLPADPHLPRPDLGDTRYPALLPFPEKASLAFLAQDEGRPIALETLRSLLLRCWMALPPGKIRCTIFDPVGRGENFAAFMHLADFDESLVHGRIWTEGSQIDQRLADLTQHMENVLQKYLRNQYNTLAEYNAQAGEVAEPFRFLVVADFPVNFNADSVRRLTSLASAGSRCGIYTFVMIDTRVPMPHGVDRRDLEDACVCLEWDGREFKWNDPEFSRFPIHLDMAPVSERMTGFLQKIGANTLKALRVEVPYQMILPPSNQWWTTESRTGLAAPLGRAGARQHQWLELGKGTSQHVLVAGKTGAGKSTLLHVLITQLAMRYSPSELELYLIDFKKGVEFKCYAEHRLPHARVVAIESEREFGISVLERLDQELSKRGEIFRTFGVNDLPSYREKRDRLGKGEPMPRILLLVDEFQEFFVEDDKLAQEAGLLLDRLVRQGRAFGMHVFLGSQTLGGAYGLARSTMDQMAVRIAMQCSEADAHLILDRENTEARLLSRPGEAIYNASHGLLEGNRLFQVVWLEDSFRDQLLSQVHDLSRKREEFLVPLVFEGTAPAEITHNATVLKAWSDPHPPKGVYRAWQGDALAIKEPTCATFRKQSGCNLLTMGQSEPLAFQMLVASLVSLGGAFEHQESASPSLHVVVANALEPEQETILNALTEVVPLRIYTPREMPTLLNELADQVNIGLNGGAMPHPQFLFLFGLHRLKDLRKGDDDFGFSRRADEAPTPSRQFMHLVREGPPLGIFTCTWCDNLLNLQRSLDRGGLREFDMRVLMQMSAADSAHFMDSPLASKLGPHRAIFYTEDQGKMEKFRPFALPTAEWINALPSHRHLGDADLQLTDRRV